MIRQCPHVERLLVAAAVWAFTCPVAAAEILPAGGAAVVPPAERDAEHARLKRLGLAVPPGGVVLERPFAPPFSPRSFVVPQKWFEAKTGRDVAVADLLADLPVLEEVMSRAYGGWETAAARGWDWRRWFADWRAALDQQRERGRLPVEEAFAPVRRLMSFQLDNHTNLPLGVRAGASGSRSWVLASPPAAPCTEALGNDGGTLPLDPRDPSQQPRRAQAWDAALRRLRPVWYLSHPSGRGALSAIRCGRRIVAVTAASTSDEATRRQRILALVGAQEDRPTLLRLSPKVAYLRLPNFTKKNTEALVATKPSWPRPNGDEIALVVDLRDNDGGDAAVLALEGWIDPKRFAAAEQFSGRQGASCVYPALRWGYTQVSSIGLEPPISEGLRGDLQHSLDQLFQRADPSCPARFETTHGSWTYRQHRFLRRLAPGQRRLVVLVDEGCGSDCEYMTYLLASLPEAVIVGSNTYGVGQFIQPGYSVLPHTRLPFRIALGTSDLYGDGRSFDGYGLDVDVLLPRGDELSRDSLLALVGLLAR